MVKILMVYISGTQKMIRVALDSLKRHNAGFPWELTIITDKNDPDAFTEASLFKAEGFEVVEYDVGTAKSGSGQHGRLLDRAIKDVTAEYTLTMDSDCFPIADGWLKDLVEMINQEGDKPIIAAGIRWPWMEIDPEKVSPETLEWKIRCFHNRENLQPACQLIKTEEFRKHEDWKFADPTGKDTNHGFMMRAKEAGYAVVGWDLTRCALPDAGVEFNPEFNRHESVIYGDKVYHHVGASRECKGQTKGKTNIFGVARENVYNESGAEWMLEPGNSYVFKFDREQEVVDFKMNMTYQIMKEYLLNHGCLFSNDWA